MEKGKNKTDGPACACGKGDLYEEWLKLNPDKRDDNSVSGNTSLVNKTKGNIQSNEEKET